MTSLVVTGLAQPWQPAAVGSRNAGLDVARAAAILLVFLAHTTSFFTAGWPRLQLSFDQFGQMGVELFFSLSGFLIGGLLIRLARGGLDAGGIGRFLARRWFRTLPLYYAVLTVVCLWIGRFEWRPYLLMQNFGPFDQRILTVSWSLVMEEYFYLFFPLLMAALGALSLQRCRGAGCVATAAAGLLLGCTAARVAHLLGYLPIPAENFQYHPFYRLDCAAWGVLAACMAARWPGIGAGLQGWRGALAAAISLGGIGGLNAMFLHLPDPAFQLAIGFPNWGFAWLATEQSLANLTWAVLVVALWANPGAVPAPLRPGIGWLSLLSYSIYLVHLPIVSATERHAAALGPTLRFLVVVGLTLGVSGLTYAAIERPFLRLRDRLVPG